MNFKTCFYTKGRDILSKKSWVCYTRRMSEIKVILAIESSCDETAAAVVKEGRTVLGSAVSSQIEIHRRYGGVVPEIASRNHTLAIENIIKETIKKPLSPLTILTQLQ